MSKEKQIEDIAKSMCRNYGTQVCASCDAHATCMIHLYAVDVYNADYRKTEWISVDERLPEIEGDARTWGELKIRKSVRVLCACVQKSGKTFVKEGYCEMWGSGVVWKIPGTVDSVTHWMPLPMPPKGDEGK